MEVRSPNSKKRSGSNDAATPMTWGQEVAKPWRATPCKASSLWRAHLLHDRLHKAAHLICCLCSLLLLLFLSRRVTRTHLLQSDLDDVLCGLHRGVELGAESALLATASRNVAAGLYLGAFPSYPWHLPSAVACAPWTESC